jgi:hypothetical protein
MRTNEKTTLDKVSCSHRRNRWRRGRVLALGTPKYDRHDSDLGQTGANSGGGS